MSLLGGVSQRNGRVSTIKLLETSLNLAPQVIPIPVRPRVPIKPATKPKVPLAGVAMLTIGAGALLLTLFFSAVA